MNVRATMKMILPWVENIVFSLFSVWVNAVFGLPFDIRLLYIMLMGLIYGVVQSTTAAVLCFTVGYLLHMFEMGVGIDIVVLETLIAFLFVALVSGFSATAKQLENKLLKDSYGRLECLYSKLKNNVSEARKAAATLSEQLKTSENSFGKLYSMIKKLENWTVNELLDEIPGMLKELTGFKDIVVYLLATDGKSFFYRSSTLLTTDRETTKQSVDLEDQEIMQEVFEKKKLYINIRPGNRASGAIISVQDKIHQRVSGVVMIKDIPFEKLNVNTEYMLNFVEELISDYLSKAIRREEFESKHGEGGIAV